MRKLVAVFLVAIWPAVTSHALLERIGVLHVVHHESHSDQDATDKDSVHLQRGHVHHHLHHHTAADGDSHEHENRTDNNHVFADGDYSWTGAAKTLIKPKLLVENSPALCYAFFFHALEPGLDSPGPAPPKAAPPLIQNTWLFSHRAALPIRAPSAHS